MPTLAVLNQKGGVGKTTIATNIAAAAHLAGHRTLVIDMDQQHSSSEWFAARADQSKLAGLVVVQMDRRLTVPKFQELSFGYDFVVLDGPPRLDEVTCSAAVAADVVLIPVAPSPFDLWATDKTLETLGRADEIRAQLDRRPVQRLFLVNQALRSSTLTQEVPEALGESGEVLEVMVCQRVAFRRAATSGESVLTVGDDVAAREEVLSLFKVLWGRL